MNLMEDEPWFCLLKCECGISRTENLETADDTCEECGDKMRLIRKWKASDY